MTSFSGNVLERRQQAVVEFLAWADHPAQVQSHPDRLDQRSALEQRLVSARRRPHAKQLHDGVMALLRYG